MYISISMDICQSAVNAGFMQQGSRLLPQEEEEEEDVFKALLVSSSFCKFTQKIAESM